MISRRIWLSAWCSLLLLVPTGWALAQSGDWQMRTFNSDITIRTDASILVKETIEANFLTDKHGIFRNIPYRYSTDQGGTLSVPVSVVRVTRNGNSEPYSTSTSGNELRIQIGDADVTITGRQTYMIDYTAQAAVNFFDDHDELYWNVTGDDWDVSIGDVTATVSIDADVASANLQTRCLTGAYGSTAENCSASTTDSAVSFSAAGQPLTIVVGWPKGVVTKPDNYDRLRTQGTTSNPLKSLAKNSLVQWFFNLILPVVVIAAMIQRYLRHGRDPHSQGTVIAQYDPPPGLTPGEMGTLFDERANHRDIVATIVDMAVRGFLTITEIQKDTFLGLGQKKDYQLDRTRSDTDGLRSHEQTLIDSLFADGNSVTLSSLKGKFAQDVRAIQTALYAQVAEQGYFVRNPNSVRTGYIIGGAVIAFLGFAMAVLGLFGVLIAGLTIAIIGPFMPKRTQAGADALWHSKGFKLFLEKAEKYRLQWQEREHIFEKFLPYAMAFGVAEQWSKTFEGIQQANPTWYHGAPGAHFNSLVLWSALNDFSSQTVKSFAPPAASGSSGFGGGGFSGGGFGGGGGGSW